MPDHPAPVGAPTLAPVVPARLDGVGLHDCDAEPIHVPGHVQPHGALLAFDAQGLLRNWSGNCAALIGVAPRLLQPWSEMGWPQAVTDALARVRDEAAGRTEPTPPQLVDIDAADGLLAELDVVVHGHGGRVIVEFERRARDDLGDGRFLARVHRLVDRLQRQRDMLPLLATVTDEVRVLTGFDRVMLYRFLHDDSGEVVAEARRDDLDPLLGMRYPASDIPAQARRLYVLSTLRLIADVADAPVPVLGHPEDPPLDMSHAVLRSVSPIHVEYLRNMGVHASMSISIVIDGRLWGLVACHHDSPRRVSYAVRTACDLVAQVLAARIAGLDGAARAALALQAARTRARLAESLQAQEDLLAAHAPLLAELVQMFQSDAVAVLHNGRRLCAGPVDEAQLDVVAGSLPGGTHWVERSDRGDWPADAQARIGGWVGLLAIGFDPSADGWVLVLRQEQTQQVRWAGRPEKVYRQGPRGPRLSPRGSFAEWRETVRDRAVPWSDAERTAGRHLQVDLQREAMARHADLERARTQMLAVLGHDLRDPLHTIRMAAGALERTQGGDVPQRIGERIKSSSGRMERLVGHLLDLGRIHSGRGLEVHPAPADLAVLLRDVVDEVRVAHPTRELTLQAPDQLQAVFDADRLAQVVSNLLNNAHQHGSPNHGITVSLRPLGDGQAIVLDVRNVAPPLAPEVADHLFQAFKRRVADGASRHRGLGLGLYIAHHLVAQHGGTLHYRYEAPEVVFRIELPTRAGAGQAPG